MFKKHSDDVTLHFVRKISIHETEYYGGGMFTMIPKKHFYVQKHSHDVRLRCDRKLSLHETENFIFAILTLQLRCH